MSESDSCPHCDMEIKPSDVFELSDVSGNEVDELIECPNCGKLIRANLGTSLHISLTSEDDYLWYLLSRQESTVQLLIAHEDKYYKGYYIDRLNEINREIEQVRKNIKFNNDVLGDFNDL